MELFYNLVSRNGSIQLFSSKVEYKSEEPAIIGFEHAIQTKKSTSTEKIVRDAYANLRNHYDHTSSPVLLLRMLLANSFELILTREDYAFRLCKDHYRLRYVATNGPKQVGIGDFYRTTVTTSDEQFPEFCRWADQKCGVPGSLKFNIGMILASGFDIQAREQGRTTTLLKVSRSGAVIHGEKATLDYLTSK